MGRPCALTASRVSSWTPSWSSVVTASRCIRAKKIMEMIHVKFNELTAMASEYLDNLFGPLYEEYYALSTSEVSNNSATNTLDDEDTLSSSSIIVEDIDAPQIVTSSEEPITQESSNPVLET
ncbi:hypothetical protein Tco_0503670 [Tanacetum coccineum]